MNPLAAGQIVSTLLDKAAKIALVAKDATAYAGTTSLSDVTKLTRVEPICLVSKDLLNNPTIKVVLNALNSMFAGQYLQAVDLLTKVQDVEVVKLLDRLNPNREETGFLIMADKWASERAQESFSLVSMESYSFRLPTRARPALEAVDLSQTEVDLRQAELDKKEAEIQARLAALDPNSPDYAKDKSKLDSEHASVQHQYAILVDTVARQTASHDAKSADHALKKEELGLKKDDSALRQKEFDLKRREFREQGEGQDIASVDLDTLVNLSVGRLINVKIAYTKGGTGDDAGENRFVTIPVNVRLLVSSVSNDSLLKVLGSHTSDNSFSERVHSWRAGNIRFIQDLIFCQDLIDQSKKAMIEDKSGSLQEITRRVTNARKYGLLTKNPSLATASTLVVISASLAKELEVKLGGHLSNPRIRQKAFDNTYAMIIVVVDEAWETVTFYNRGVARESTFGFRELEGKTKGNGADIGDIMKALTAGQPPSF